MNTKNNISLLLNELHSRDSSRLVESLSRFKQYSNVGRTPVDRLSGTPPPGFGLLKLDRVLYKGKKGDLESIVDDVRDLSEYTLKKQFKKINSETVIYIVEVISNRDRYLQAYTIDELDKEVELIEQAIETQKIISQIAREVNNLYKKIGRNPLSYNTEPSHKEFLVNSLLNPLLEYMNTSGINKKAIESVSEAFVFAVKQGNKEINKRTY